jgi:hypothetical protein
MAADEPTWRPLEWLISATAGALVSLVAFRTRLALMQGELNDRKNEIAEVRASSAALVKTLEKKLDDRAELLDKRFGQIDRREIEMMRLLADIARAVGADRRFTDSVLRMLADENQPIDPPQRHEREP